MQDFSGAQHVRSASAAPAPRRHPPFSSPPSTPSSPSSTTSTLQMPSRPASPTGSAEPGPSSSAMHSHLSYPAPSADPAPSPPAPAHPRPLLQERLYVGNLHPSVDEYTLLQAFSKFGRVSKLDFLFHKAGPHKGRPRGYAFVEYAAPEDAHKALAGAHEKLLRGRRLVVTHAHQAPPDHAAAHAPGAPRFRRTANAGKPTTLSMLKSAAHGRADATDAKIARMEAKLRQMDQAEAAATSRPALHPSLPPRPTSGLPAAVSSASASQRQSAPADRRTVLPSLPIKANSSPATPTLLAPPRGESARRAPASLAGVRIVRNKDR